MSYFGGSGNSTNNHLALYRIIKVRQEGRENVSCNVFLLRTGLNGKPLTTISLFLLSVAKGYLARCRRFTLKEHQRPNVGLRSACDRDLACEVSPVQTSFFLFVTRHAGRVFSNRYLAPVRHFCVRRKHAISSQDISTCQSFVMKTVGFDDEAYVNCLRTVEAVWHCMHGPQNSSE